MAQEYNSKAFLAALRHAVASAAASVKAGAGLRYSDSETLAVDFGNGLEVNPNTGMLEVPIGEGLNYTSDGIELATATTEGPGGIIVGDGLVIDDSGRLSASATSLSVQAPIDVDAGTQTLKLAYDGTLTVNDGKLSVVANQLAADVHSTVAPTPVSTYKIQVGDIPVWINEAATPSQKLRSGAFNVTATSGAVTIPANTVFAVGLDLPASTTYSCYIVTHNAESGSVIFEPITLKTSDTGKSILFTTELALSAAYPSAVILIEE